MKDLKTQTLIMMDRAKQAVLSRDYQLAARLYKNLLQNDPENLVLLKNLGNLYERSGNDKDSIPIYNEIVRLDPKNIDALNALGGIYRRLKQYDKSISVLEKAVIVDENNSQVFYNLGYTYKLMEKYDDALACFDRVVDANPNDALAYNHLGTIYALEEKHDKAIAAYQRGLKVDPNHPILHLNLAKSYEQTGNYELSIGEYENALRYKPGWLDAIDGYADLLLHRNKTQQAQDLIKQALTLNPDDSNLHNKMGKVYKEQNNFDAAENEYNGVLEKKSDDRNALSGLADTYEAGGKYTQALHTMEHLDRLYPDDNSVLKQYSHILLSANKLNEAGKKIKAVWDKNPDDVQTLNLLGQWYICRNEEAKAFGCFKRIDSLNPNYKEYLRDVAERYSQNSKLDKAIEYNDRYLSINEDSTKALYNRARYLEKKQDYDAAMAAYKKLNEIDGANLAYSKGLERSRVKLGLEDDDPENLKSKSIYKNIDVDDDIAPDFGIEEVPLDYEESAAEETVENPEEEKMPSLEEQIRLSQDDTEAVLDTDKLTEEDLNTREIFDRLDDEIKADELEEEEKDELLPDLDSLVKTDPIDEANDFFEQNPFASGGRPAAGPVEDNMESAFQAEDIGDSMPDDSVMDISDGLSTPDSLPSFNDEEMPDYSERKDGRDDYQMDMSAIEPENFSPAERPPVSTDRGGKPAASGSGYDAAPRPSSGYSAPSSATGFDDSMLSPDDLSAPSSGPGLNEETISPEDFSAPPSAAGFDNSAFSSDDFSAPSNATAFDDSALSPDDLSAPSSAAAFDDSMLSPDDLSAPSSGHGFSEETLSPEDFSAPSSATGFDDSMLSPDDLSAPSSGPGFSEETLSPDDMSAPSSGPGFSEETLSPDDFSAPSSATGFDNSMLSPDDLSSPSSGSGFSEETLSPEDFSAPSSATGFDDSALSPDDLSAPSSGPGFSEETLSPEDFSAPSSSAAFDDSMLSPDDLSAPSSEFADFEAAAEAVEDFDPAFENELAHEARAVNDIEDIDPATFHVSSDQAEEVEELQEDAADSESIEELARENNVPLTLDEENSQMNKGDSLSQEDPAELSSDGYFVEEPSSFLKDSFLNDDFEGSEGEMELTPPGFTENVEEDGNLPHENNSLDNDRLPAGRDSLDEEDTVSDEEALALQEGDLAVGSNYELSDVIPEDTAAVFDALDKKTEPEKTVSPEDEVPTVDSLLSDAGDEPETIIPGIDALKEFVNNSRKEEAENIPAADPKLDTGLVNESNDETLSLLITLKKLADYLPEESRKLFYSSKEYLQLEYLISRLTGNNESFLNAAEHMRNEMAEDDYEHAAEENNSPEKIKSLFLYLRDLISQMPASDLTRDLDCKLESAIEDLQDMGY